MEIIKMQSQARSEARDSYSRVVVVGDWAMVSITAGVDFTTREVSPDPAVQAAKMIDNVEKSLKEVGFALADVVKAGVYIAHPRNFDAIIAVYGERFRDIRPANTVLCAPLGSPDLAVEMDAMAYRGAGAMPQQRRQMLI